MIYQIHLFIIGKTATPKKFPGSLLCKTKSELLNEETGDQEEFRNSGIQLMVERWTLLLNTLGNIVL